MNHSSVLPLALATPLLQSLHHVLALSAEPCHALRDQVASLSRPLLHHTSHPGYHLPLRTRTPWTARRMWPTDPPNRLQPPGAREPPGRTQAQPTRPPGLRHQELQDPQPWRHRHPVRHHPTATLLVRTAQGRSRRRPTILCSSGTSSGHRRGQRHSRPGRTRRSAGCQRSNSRKMLEWFNANITCGWSVGVLRNVTAAVSSSIAAHLQAMVQRQTLLDWLEQAHPE